MTWKTSRRFWQTKVLKLQNVSSTRAVPISKDLRTCREWGGFASSPIQRQFPSVPGPFPDSSITSSPTVRSLEVAASRSFTFYTAQGISNCCLKNINGLRPGVAMSAPCVSRRDLIATAVALVCPRLLLAADTQPATAPADPIIDIHQHTNYSGRTDDQLLRHQRAMGVTQTILLPAGSPVNRPSTHDGKTN